MTRKLSNFCYYMSARCVFATVIAIFALSQPASAQQETRINGVVRDATGAAISGVTVIATHETTRDLVVGADEVFERQARGADDLNPLLW